MEAGLCLFGAESCKFFWYSDFYSNSRKINVIKLEYLRTADFFFFNLTYLWGKIGGDDYLGHLYMVIKPISNFFYCLKD